MDFTQYRKALPPYGQVRLDTAGAVTTPLIVNSVVFHIMTWKNGTRYPRVMHPDIYFAVPEYFNPTVRALEQPNCVVEQCQKHYLCFLTEWLR